MNHSPLPWRLGVKHPGRIISQDFVAQVTVHFDDDDFLTNQERANAEFIVRACNAFPDLLAAVKALQVRVFIHEGASDEYQMASSAIDKATN